VAEKNDNGNQLPALCNSANANQNPFAIYSIKIAIDSANYERTFAILSKFRHPKAHNIIKFAVAESI